MSLDKKSYIIIVLAAALVLLLANSALAGYCASCTQRGIDGTLDGIVGQIKLRGMAVSINVGDEQLVCSTRGLLDDIG